MKIYIMFFLLISNILFIKSEDEFEYHDYEGNPDNINIESIQYELTYNNHSVVKVVIKTYDEIESDISFIAYLKSSSDEKEYKLNCSSTFYDIIECLSDKDAKFDTEKYYYFYYNKTKSKFTFDENEVLEDDKQISLVFKPEINIEDRLYKDNRKITAETNGKMVGGGYLYITRKTKEVLNKPKDGFNQYIELNNFIPKVGLHNDIPISTLKGYKKAIKRGYHIVDAVLRFTHDKVPVISHENDLSKISDGQGLISEYTYLELLKLDFGSKIDKEYEGEKILSLQVLLQLCADLDVIIDLDLSQLNTKKFVNDSSYGLALINTIKKFEMFDSVYFSDGPEYPNLLALKKLKHNIAVSVTGLNKKENFQKIKEDFAGSRIIISSGEISYENGLTEDHVKDGVASGKKVKVGIVDDVKYANKIQFWGVNYITTKSIPSFLIENEKEEPIIVRCNPVDDEHSECEIEDDIILKDNEWYNIYYSDNIYNTSQDINEDPIGEFLYVDTNILDELYYKINKFNFERGIVNLNLSQELKRGEDIYGIVGPDFENVPLCYLYNFVCHGNGGFNVDCKIQKEEEGKVEYHGNYTIYSLEDYSLNEFETEERSQPEETYYEYIVEKKSPYFFIFCVIFIIIVICAIIYFVKYKQPAEAYNRIRIADNNYLSDNYLYR